MSLEFTLANIRKKGWRITQIRKEMVKIFCETKRPLSAKDIKIKLAQMACFANKTTIYRELQFLVSNGYLFKVYISPRQILYESSELSHHHHLVCDKCGKIDEVVSCLAPRIEKNVFEKKGFKIERHVVEFYGLCRDCLALK